MSRLARFTNTKWSVERFGMEMIMGVGIGLYVKNSAEAVETYIKAFHMELGYHVKNDDGSYFHSELWKDGEEMLSVVETKEETQVVRNPVQLGITFETKEELEYAYKVLSATGIVKMEPCELPWSPWAAEVTDFYGINWYLTLQQHQPEEGFKPDQQ